MPTDGGQLMARMGLNFIRKEMPILMTGSHMKHDLRSLHDAKMSVAIISIQIFHSICTTLHINHGHVTLVRERTVHR